MTSRLFPLSCSWQNLPLWLRAISKHKAVISPAPNFAFGLYLEKITDEEMNGVDLSSWQLALNGAEPIAPSVLANFNSRFSKWGLRKEALTPVYGLAEAALAVTFSKIDTEYLVRSYRRGALSRGRATRGGHMQLVSVGTPLAGYAVEIRDTHGRALNQNTVGRIWISGPSIMRGYVGSEQDVLEDGWFDTGDLGFIDEGDLFITGREKDVVVHRGRNHAAHDLEHCCDLIPGV